MSSDAYGLLRDLPHPSLNDAIKTNSFSAIKMLKTVGEFVHKVGTIKEQTAHQLFSLVESFRKKNTEMKKESNKSALTGAFSSWEILLGEYEKEAQEMLKISSKLMKQVSMSLFDDAMRKKILCKRLFGFREDGENQLEKSNEALQKSHKEYSDACVKLSKLQSTGGEPGKQDHFETLCQNSHNAYVLQLNAYNSMNNLFYSKTLPDTLDDLQAMQEEITRGLAVALKECATIEKSTVMDSVQRLGSIEGMFDLVDSRKDIGNFVQSNNAGKFSAPVTSFQKPEEQPSSLHLPTNKLYLVDVTEPVLKRKYVALKKKLRNLESKVKKEHEEVKSIKKLQDSYTQNPSYGNAAEVEENLLKQKNSQRTKEWLCDVTSQQLKLFGDILSKLRVSEADLADEKISDDEAFPGVMDKRQSVIGTRNRQVQPRTDQEQTRNRQARAGQHQFEDYTFKKPKFCYYCKNLIKGIIKQGLRCKACRMSVHHKCKDNVPYCPGDPELRRTKKLAHQQVSIEDDSDGPLYSDVEDSPTPPPRRKSLGKKDRLRKEEDLYDTAEEVLPCGKSVSICVALYDYDGQNEGDLRLSAGNKIRILNNADQHWWEGSCKGVVGFFPATYVQVISQDDVILRCLYDFAGQDKDELTIELNQIIILIRDEGNGWMYGKTGSVEGAFPSTYVEKLQDNGPD